MWFVVFMLIVFSDIPYKYLVIIFACACMVQSYSFYLDYLEYKKRLEIVAQSSVLSSKFYNDTINLIKETRSIDYE